MILNEVLDVYESYFRIKIIDQNKNVIYVGLLANLSKPGTYHNPDITQIGLTGLEAVEKLVTALDVSHKEWKERNLMPPILPEMASQYRFSDLQLSQYYEIHLAA